MAKLTNGLQKNIIGFMGRGEKKIEDLCLLFAKKKCYITF